MLLDKRGIFPKIGQTINNWLTEKKNSYKSYKEPILIKACHILDSLFGVFPDWCVFTLTNKPSLLYIAYYDETKEEIFISKFIADFFGYDITLILAHEMCHACRKDFEYDMFDEFLAHMVYDSFYRRFFGMCFSNVYISLMWIFSCFLILFASFCLSVKFVFMFGFSLFVFWSGVFSWIYFYKYRQFEKAHKVLIKHFGCESIAGYVLFRITQSEALKIAWLGFSMDMFFDKTARWTIINMAFQKYCG